MAEDVILEVYEHNSREVWMKVRPEWVDGVKGYLQRREEHQAKLDAFRAKYPWIPRRWPSKDARG